MIVWHKLNDRLAYFNPNTWALLIPEKDTNGLADNKCNEPVPIEEVQDKGRNYAYACYE